MERRCKTPKPAGRCAAHDVPDDLLRLILLRLDSPLWLVRVACVCKRWRGIVTDGGDGGRAFLRLARSLHPPVVVGHYHNYFSGGHQFVPSSPMPIRLPSLDFFLQETAGKSSDHRRSTTDRWKVVDCHGGLVLLRNEICCLSDTDLVVCDPLSRRYRDIHHPANQTYHHHHHHLPSRRSSSRLQYVRPHIFLLDGGDDDGNISLSNFRVLYCCSYYSNDHGRVVYKVHVFSTADDGGDWRLVRQSFDDSGLHCHYERIVGRVDRSLYLTSLVWPTIGVLDNSNARLVLSKINLPTRMRNSGLDYGNSTFAVVYGHSREPTASPATAYIVHVFRDDLELFRRNPSSGEWLLEHSIHRLSEATCGLQGHPEPSRWRKVDIIAGGTGLAVLRVSLTRGDRTSWLFSLDVDTMQLQVLPEPEMDSYPINPIIYTLPWPQFLTASAMPNLQA